LLLNQDLRRIWKRPVESQSSCG